MYLHPLHTMYRTIVFILIFPTSIVLRENKKQHTMFGNRRIFRTEDFGVPPFLMLAKVRVSRCRQLTPFLGFPRPCGSGSVIILEDGHAMSTQSKAKNPIRKSKLAGGIYVMPQEYSVLLEQLRSGKIGSTELDASGEIIEKPLEASALENLSENPESSDSQSDLRRRFWGRAGAIARQRIKSKLPDLSTAEARVARLHESLWVEELRMTLELQSLRSCVDEIKPLGNGLFILDISEMFDEISYSLAQFLQRGLQVQISSNDGQTCLAFVQPGSDSGKLVLSSTESIEHMRGPYDIEFLPNRFPQRAMHRALDCERVKDVLTEVQGVAEDVEETLAVDTGDTTGPSGPNGKGQAEVVLPPSLNSVQRRALVTAIESRNRFPLLVWGPPGTGKSTLAAFLVWHLVQENSQFQILVTAPSNTGADVLCGKLTKLGLDHSRMLRLNALGRNVKTVPEEIQSYGSTTQRDGRTVFQIPQLSKLRRFRVIVTTCICASHIANTVRKEGAVGWFTHAIVDEAGEATEPETLVPIQLLSHSGVANTSQIILFGDHFQLGPLVISSLASRIGKLNTSMIERLVNKRFQAAQTEKWRNFKDEAENRQRQGLNRDTLAVCESKGLFFLTESFRSHPDIMKIYSKAGYVWFVCHVLIWFVLVAGTNGNSASMHLGWQLAKNVDHHSYLDPRRFPRHSRDTSLCDGDVLGTCCVVWSDGGIGTWQQEMFLNEYRYKDIFWSYYWPKNMWRSPRSGLAVQLFSLATRALPVCSGNCGAEWRLFILFCPWGCAHGCLFSWMTVAKVFLLFVEQVEQGALDVLHHLETALALNETAIAEADNFWLQTVKIR